MILCEKEITMNVEKIANRVAKGLTSSGPMREVFRKRFQFTTEADESKGRGRTLVVENAFEDAADEFAGLIGELVGKRYQMGADAEVLVVGPVKQEVKETSEDWTTYLLSGEIEVVVLVRDVDTDEIERLIQNAIKVRR
jgi:hypothetical protein